MPLTLLPAPPDSKSYLHLCICIAKIIKLCKRNKKNQIRMSNISLHQTHQNVKYKTQLYGSCDQKNAGTILVIIRGFEPQP